MGQAPPLVFLGEMTPPLVNVEFLLKILSNTVTFGSIAKVNRLT